MKNYEKYAEEIKEYKGSSFCRDFIVPHILNSSDCNGANCFACQMQQMIWLLEDYKEPETDWSKVEVDTPILVRNREDEKWNKRHFAEYKDGKVYTWYGGFTSWTIIPSNVSVNDWKYAKLAESEEGGAK